MPFKHISYILTVLSFIWIHDSVQQSISIYCKNTKCCNYSITALNNGILHINSVYIYLVFTFDCHTSHSIDVSRGVQMYPPPHPQSALIHRHIANYYNAHMLPLKQCEYDHNILMNSYKVKTIIKE